MSAKDATRSAKDATTSAKDGSQKTKDATRCTKMRDYERQGGDQCRGRGTCGRSLAVHDRVSQMPAATPPRHPSEAPPPLSSRVFNINTQIIIFGNLVNPSIPKMEVLDACF